MLFKALVFGAAIYLLWRATSKWLDAPEPKRPSRRVEAGPSPWEILGVGEGADRAAVKAAYQRKIREYHPDRVADMAPELQRLAEERTKQINAAYETIEAEWRNS